MQISKKFPNKVLSAYLCFVKLLFLFFLLSANLISRAEHYQLFEERGKVGMKNDQGQVIIPPSFEALGWSDGSFSVIGQTTGYRLNKQWGLINLKKEFITKPEFKELVYQGGEYVVVRKQLSPVSIKSGCINLQGQIVLPFVYDGIEVNGLRAIVFNLIGTKFNYGLTDLQNHVLIPLSYKSIFSLGTLRYAVESGNGKIALFSEEGKPVTDFKIDSLSKFYKGYSIIYENGAQGLIDREGVMVLPTQYQSIKVNEEGVAYAKLPDEWTYLTSNNKILGRIFADDLKPASNKRHIVRSAGRYGLMDDQQKWLIPLQWDSLREIQQDLFFVRAKGKWGAVRSDNQAIVPVVFDSLCIYDFGFRVFVKGGGWELLNPQGKRQMQKSYSSLDQFNRSTWKARSGIYWGLLNAKGEEIIHCVFDFIGDRTANLVAVKFKGQYGIVDLHENWIVPPQPYPIRLANDTHYLLIQPDNSFLKSVDGTLIYFSSRPVEFKENYWVEIMPDGRENPISYDGVSIHVDSTNSSHLSGAKRFHLHEGLKGILKDGKYGFVDAEGRLRIANRYDSIGDFHEGLAPIKLIGMWGFIDPQDKIAVQPNYESVTEFVNGLSIVKRNGKMGLLNKNGKAELPLRYSDVRLLPNGNFLLQQNQLKGIANKNGGVEIEPRFDFLQDLNNGFLIAGSGGKFGLITGEGLDRIPFIYDKLIFDPSKDMYLAMKRSEWKAMK
jgi:hypothetical protein